MSNVQLSIINKKWTVVRGQSKVQSLRPKVQSRGSDIWILRSCVLSLVSWIFSLDTNFTNGTNSLKHWAWCLILEICVWHEPARPFRRVTLMALIVAGYWFEVKGEGWKLKFGAWYLVWHEPARSGRGGLHQWRKVVLRLTRITLMTRSYFEFETWTWKLYGASDCISTNFL